MGICEGCLSLPRFAQGLRTRVPLGNNLEVGQLENGVTKKQTELVASAPKLNAIDEHVRTPSPMKDFKPGNRQKRLKIPKEP